MKDRLKFTGWVILTVLSMMTFPIWVIIWIWHGGKIIPFILIDKLIELELEVDQSKRIK